jgi:hypothetical protein
MNKIIMKKLHYYNKKTKMKIRINIFNYMDLLTNQAENKVKRFKLLKMKILILIVFLSLM